MSARLYASHEALPGAGKPPLLFPDLRGISGDYRSITIHGFGGRG